VKVSVVTVVYNNADTIGDAVRSVLEQDHADIEHVVIDGASTDGTLAVLEPFRDRIAHLVSEPDDGIYDAMNKGIGLSSGEVVGFLNADDMFLHPGVASRIVRELEETGADCTFGDLVYVEPDNVDRVTRYYRSDKFRPGRLAWGWMPPHPTFSPASSAPAASRPTTPLPRITNWSSASC
jgi:glycosyltransferase